MELKLIEINEFKKDAYKHYKKTFPNLERKLYRELKYGYYNKITKFYKVIEDNNYIGFIITQNLENNKCALLECFVIFPQFRSRGYGKEAIKTLRDLLKDDYYGILVEVEKADLGKNKKENEIRERRIKFYENIGFIDLGFDISLFNIIFSAYILPTTQNLDDKQKIINDLFDIYKATLKEKKANKYCKIL